MHKEIGRKIDEFIENADSRDKKSLKKAKKIIKELKRINKKLNK